MFTKAYLFTLKTLQAYNSTHNPGVFLRKDALGSQKYIGASGPAVSPSTYIKYETPFVVSDSPNQNCVTFSDDATPFLDDDTVYKYTTPSGISSISYLNISHATTNNGYSITIRYSVQNGGSQDVTLRKFVAYNDMRTASTLGSLATSYSKFLSLVQEITPVTIPAGGTAVIDVTIETEIPE